MIVVRLVVLVFLGCIAWLLLRGMVDRKKKEVRGRAESGTGKVQQDPGVQDILVEDPVCHTLVPKNQAIRLRRDGKTYYFCSEACCDKFTGKERGEE